MIEVARLNGSFRYVVISQGLDKPRAISVHPAKGWGECVCILNEDGNVCLWTWENCVWSHDLRLKYLCVQVSVLDGVGSVSTYWKISTGWFWEISSCQCQHQLAQWHLHWLPGLYINILCLFCRTSCWKFSFAITRISYIWKYINVNSYFKL